MPDVNSTKVEVVETCSAWLYLFNAHEHDEYDDGRLTTLDLEVTLRGQSCYYELRSTLSDEGFTSCIPWGEPTKLLPNSPPDHADPGACTGRLSGCHFWNPIQETKASYHDAYQ